MKKVLLFLLITSLAIFIFTGCEGVTPAEGEGESEAVTDSGFCPKIEISGSQVIDGKTYVKGLDIYEMEGPEELNSYDDIILTVTYSVPTEGTEAYLGGLIYGAIDTIVEEVIKSKDIGLFDLEIPMFPNEDNTIYTGSLKPYLLGWQTDCTAFMIKVVSCAGDCICKLPFIVDNQAPYAEILVESEKCTCQGCALTFSSTALDEECMDAIPNCNDDCSGLANWSIALYAEDPFNNCCETPCEEPISTCSGTTCPIECTTDCLELSQVYVLVNLVDQIGNEKEYYAIVDFDNECKITVTEYEATGWMEKCTDWTEGTLSADNTFGESIESQFKF